jgi:hypothetical protein
MCAGPFAHHLLGISQDISQRFEYVLLDKIEVRVVAFRTY